jgi:hypothetical protein
VEEYSRLTDQTVTATMNILAERQTQDDAAVSFMEAFVKYLANMKVSLGTDLAGRLDRCPGGERQRDHPGRSGSGGGGRGPVGGRQRPV